MVDLRYFVTTFDSVQTPRLTLDFSKDITAMPGKEGYFETVEPFTRIPDLDPPCLIMMGASTSFQYFDVVNYAWTDREGVRHFTNGDIAHPETSILAWALLPELNP